MGRVFTICLLLSVIGIIGVNSFGSSDDKFIKKYAMMKIYESCFGPEVVREIRKEMKAACLKCASLAEPPQDIRPIPSIHPLSPAEATKLHAGGSDAIETPENGLHPQPSFDAEKLQQAILAYRPSTYHQPPSQFRPFPAVSPFYPGYGNPSGPMFYQTGPGPYPGQNPFPVYSQFPGPVYPGQFYNHGIRMSRDMNIRDQIDYLTSRMSGKVRNVTCVMQELGYLDENLEPNFNKISQRIANLPVDEELRKDMQDGVQFCQQFSQCIPDVKKEKSPLSRELVRPMFFFRCYKHKKLEACVMKDVRERFHQGSDEDFDALSDGVRSDEIRSYRSGKAMKPEDEYDEFTSSMYDFLYGGSNVDLDALL